ncbi:MAG: leucine-rich repeat domain-containing protein [Kiritimatiellaceae bacterium]|nr:leucine-rich repeat domain-containing protein [Kiritimatiellaceae bacterium]
MKTGLKILGLLVLTFSAVHAENSDYYYTTNSGTITITQYIGTNEVVIVPATINGLPVTDIGNYAFQYYGVMTDLTIPDSVVNIGTEAFYGCGFLTRLVIGQSVVSIGESAFNRCDNLPILDIPDSVTSIGFSAFYYCNALTNATVGSGVISIDGSAFEECSRLSGIYFRGNAPTAGENIFANDNDATVYRLSEATGWPTVPDVWGGRPTALWASQNADGDADTDGIPDAWEQQYFGGITNANPVSICSNGINTVIEAYVAGLNPNDPQSVLRISASFSGEVIGWNAASGRVYSVYWTTNLMNGFQSLATNILWTQGNYTNSNITSRGYYRVNVRLAN